MTNSMINPQPNYSGVTIQISNPAVYAGNTSQACQNYQAQSYASNPIQNSNPYAQLDPYYIPPEIAQAQAMRNMNPAYPPQYYLNNYNYQNNGLEGCPNCLPNGNFQTSENAKRDALNRANNTSNDRNLSNTTDSNSASNSNTAREISDSNNTNSSSNNINGNSAEDSSNQSNINDVSENSNATSTNSSTKDVINNKNNSEEYSASNSGFENNSNTSNLGQKDSIEANSNSNSDSDSGYENTSDTSSVGQKEAAGQNSQVKNTKKYEIEPDEPQDFTKSQAVIDDLDARAAAEAEAKKNSKQKRIVALTDEYIKSLENYLNNPNDEIRLMASKEILTRLDEDKDRFDDAALNALLNKMLQDPSKLIRVAALSAFASQLASGNDYTITLLHNIQQNPNADKEDVLQAADILLKMSAGTEIKYIPNPQVKEEKK